MNGDGIVALEDASAALMFYAQKSAGLLTEEEEKEKMPIADTNRDGSLTLDDISLILAYYAACAAGNTNLPFEVWRNAQEPLRM